MVWLGWLGVHGPGGNCNVHARLKERVAAERMTLSDYVVWDAVWYRDVIVP